MLNCIIIDDEQFAVDALLKYIDLLPYLKVTGIFTDPLQALQMVSSAKDTDLIFMDIDMPSLSGIELAGVLRAKTNKLVFTTAHSKYAFDAYQVAGDAFLLKPFTFANFSTTINRLFPEKSNQNTAPASGNDYFLVKSKEDDLAIVKIKYQDVIAFESAQNYIRIHLIGDKVLTAYLTLKDVLQLTGSRPEFKQFHRAFVISTDNVTQLKGNVIQLSNHLQIPVGDTFKESFSAYLEEKLFVTSRKR
jgi:DNA-binding LytR/AlgR family response regulator